MRYAALAYLIIRKVVPIISEIIDKPNKARSINIKSPNVMPMIIIKPRLNPDENVRAITAKTAGPGTRATINIAPKSANKLSGDK